MKQILTFLFLFFSIGLVEAQSSNPRKEPLRSAQDESGSETQASFASGATSAEDFLAWVLSESRNEIRTDGSSQSWLGFAFDQSEAPPSVQSQSNHPSKFRAKSLATAWVSMKAPLKFKFEGEKTEENLIPETQTSSIVLSKLIDADVYHLRFVNSVEQELMFERVSRFYEAPKEARGISNDFETLKDIFYGKGSGDVDGEAFATNQLARFFNEMSRIRVKLNPWEQLLASELVRFGHLSIQYGVFVSESNAAVIATHESMDERKSLAHAINHALFETDLEYRKAVGAEYDLLLDVDRALVERFVGNVQYDQRNPNIVAREFAAHFRDSSNLLSDELIPVGKKSRAFELYLAVRRLDVKSQYYSKTLQVEIPIGLRLRHWIQ